MIDDLQKASIIKRASAWLFDLIMLCVLVVGAASIFSLIFNYNQRLDDLDACYTKYEQQFGVDFNLSYEDYEKLTPEELKQYNDAYGAMNKDSHAIYCYNIVLNLSLVIVTLSVLLGYLILEFLIPLALGHGRSLGKRIFNIGVMRVDGVRMSKIQLFVRTILGKFTIETMVPLLVIIMIFFNSIGIIGVLVVGGILILQLGTLIVTRTNSAIHDRLAGTVVIDMPTQMIFDTVEEMTEFKKQRAKERAESQPY